MASSACSSTQNPPKKASKVTYIDLTSNEASPQPHHATIDTTLALTIPPPIPNMVEPFASPLGPRALVFTTPPNTPNDPHPFLSSLNDAPPRPTNPFPHSLTQNLPKPSQNEAPVEPTIPSLPLNSHQVNAQTNPSVEREYIQQEIHNLQAIHQNIQEAIHNAQHVITPHKSSDDYKNTRHYIPMISHEYLSPVKERLRNLESRYIHEGRVVFEDFADLNYVRSLFHFLEFECLLEINDQIYPRFILDFYSQYQINYSDEGQMFIEFVIQNQLFSYYLEEFAQILDIPCEGACVFTDKCSLDELAYGVHTDGTYQTNPPSPDDIILYNRIDQEGQVRRIRHEEEIDVYDHQILTREILPTLKPLEEINWENVFCLGGNLEHVPACLFYMLYCVANSEKFNLAYYMTKRMEWVTKQASERLERIMAQEEVVTPLLPLPPSTNYPPLILTMMMMEMAKGPRVEALLLPFALLTL
ncbi:hypothetical protein Tco_0471033 [Tanacetum coccineum]